jgi:hypothetical protein
MRKQDDAFFYVFFLHHRLNTIHQKAAKDMAL